MMVCQALATLGLNFVAKTLFCSLLQSLDFRLIFFMQLFFCLTLFQKLAWPIFIFILYFRSIGRYHLGLIHFPLQCFHTHRSFFGTLHWSKNAIDSSLLSVYCIWSLLVLQFCLPSLPDYLMSRNLQPDLQQREMVQPTTGSLWESNLLFRP